MSKLKQVQVQIKALSVRELSRLWTWYEKFDDEVWDKQIIQASRSGKFNTLVRRILADHAAAKTSPL